jgi:L-seryl-tRNA(Ser) seleniumtransferase
MDARIASRLKSLPQVNALLESEQLRRLTLEYSHDLIKHLLQEVIEQKRQAILAGSETPLEADSLISGVKEKLDRLLRPRIRRVINATGILLHTGLGRAPLLDEAYERAFQRVRGACDLEFDLQTGARGDRQEKLDELLRLLTGAESSAVVNNNAAAVLLALNTLAYRRETIVSRGQLIEIGGSFRLPQVMKKSGSRLVEVGTTNRTYLADYAEAVTEKTGAILLAHTSNYRIRGFVQEVEIEDLAGLCRERGLPLIHDLGGGVLLDLTFWNLPPEPLASRSIAAGCSVVTFSGDKVLGGPQAGILIGKKDVMAKIRKNPLMRALRPDKLSLALLEETLKLYLSPRDLLARHPVLKALAEEPDSALRRAQDVLEELKRRGLPDSVTLEVVPTQAQLGSGALPLEVFPSAALRIQVKKGGAAQIAQALRNADPPVVGYLSQNALYLDMKAVQPQELTLMAEAVHQKLRNIKQ